MNLLEDIKLDFHIVETGNPKFLIVQDFSDWGAIENQPATIEIEIPNYEQVRKYYYNKDSYNRFNTSLLHLSSVGDYQDMPDGIYKITVKGSPSDEFCISKKYLKKDSLQLRLDTLFLGQGIDYLKCNQKILDDIYKADNWLNFAISAVKLGRSNKAQLFYNKAKDIVEYLENCKEC